VPDFPRYLLAAESLPESERERLPGAVHQLLGGLPAYAPRGDERALFAGVRAAPHDDGAWAAYSDWLEEHDRPAAGRHLLGRVLRAFFPDNGSVRDTRNPRKDQVLVQGHVAQACKHVAHWDWAGDLYHHLILFDDLWAAAHPDLVNSTLRFASRWDVL
jgi:uncharacterized protein (TIGR02996 family)